MDKIIVLNAKKVDYRRNDGQHVKGVKVNYTFSLDDFADDTNVGSPIYSGYLSGRDFDDLKAPAYYHATFRTAPNKDGNLVQYLASIEYVSAFEIYVD